MRFSPVRLGLGVQRADAPLGFDAVHYYFQVAFVAGLCPLGEATALAADRAAAALRALGVPSGKRIGWSLPCTCLSWPSGTRTLAVLRVRSTSGSTRP